MASDKFAKADTIATPAVGPYGKHDERMLAPSLCRSGIRLQENGRIVPLYLSRLGIRRQQPQAKFTHYHHVTWESQF